MPNKDSKFWQGNRDKIGFIEYAGHGETPAQRSHKNEIARRIESGESATHVYSSMKAEGRGMRKSELLEIAGYVRSRDQGGRMTPRTAQPEYTRKKPRITKSGEAKQYKPASRGTMTARGEVRKPYEYIVRVGSHESDKETTKSGRKKRIGTFVTITSDHPMSERQIKAQADKLNLADYGSKSRRYAQIRIMGVRLK